MKQYPRNRLTTVAALLASCALISACGGGGGGESETSSAAQAIVPSASSPADNAASAAVAQAPSAEASAAVAQSPVEHAQSAATTASSTTAQASATASSSTTVAAKPASTSGTTAPATTGTTSTAATQSATGTVISGQVSIPATGSDPAPQQTGVTDSSTLNSQIAASSKVTEQGAPPSTAGAKLEASSTDCALYSVRQFGTNSACYANAVGTVPNGSSLSFASSRTGYVGSTTASCSAGVVSWSAETCVRTTASATANLPAPPALSTSPTQQALTLEGRQARLRSAIADMTLDHEVVPAGVGTDIGWKYRASVAMGTEPYGSAIGSWWTGTRFAQWKAMLAWFVIYPGEGGNPANNSAVEVNGLELWHLSSKDKVWRRVQANALPTWGDTVAQNAISTTTTVGYSLLTASSAVMAPASNNMMHGGLGQSATPWNTTTDLGDMDAFFVAIRHRLVLKNPFAPDDRQSANLGLQSGADYYPFVGAKVSDLNSSYVPGAAVGRFIKVTKNWRYSTVLVRSTRITESAMMAITPPVLTY